jgi:hypothetical protein
MNYLIAFTSMQTPASITTCVPECPVEAIFADNNVPEDQAQWTQVNIDEAPNYPSNQSEDSRTARPHLYRPGRIASSTSIRF